MAKVGDRFRYVGDAPLAGHIRPGEEVTVGAVGADDPAFGSDLVVEVPPDPEAEAGSPDSVGRCVSISKAQLGADFEAVTSDG